jgi:hypothetical protein
VVRILYGPLTQARVFREAQPPFKTCALPPGMLGA